MQPSPTWITPESFAQAVSEYRPTEACNDAVWEDFTEAVNRLPWLREHRDWVEQNEWGFGDRAFHYMWHLLLGTEFLRKPDAELLEIGVYKGQVISLWALIAKRSSCRPRITAITPLEGTHAPLPSFMHHVALRLFPRYRRHAKSGNQYRSDDYGSAVRRIFEHFCLDLSLLELIRGYSEEASVKNRIRDRSFDLIYIDGGHTFEEANHDIEYYGARVRVGGYLVIDDASCEQPGSKFWKGHESVSRAAERIDTVTFRNVLNVGHNRIFLRCA